MDAQTLNHRFRLFLLGVAAFMFVGSLAELYFAEHTESPVQLLPFVLAALGLIAIVAVYLRPQSITLRLLQGVMVLTGLGSAFGIFEHIEHNIEFALEIRPNAAVGDVFFEALGGANPLLAPGILGLGALLALAATYYHPLLQKAS